MAVNVFNFFHNGCFIMKFIIKLLVKLLILCLGIIFLIMYSQKCSFKEALEIADEALSGLFEADVES